MACCVRGMTQEELGLALKWAEIEGWNPGMNEWAGWTTFEGTTMKGSIQALGYSFDFTGSKPASSMAVLAGGAQ